MKKLSEGMKAGIVLSLVVSFMFFIYAPLEMYLSNIDEFWFDLYTLFPPMFMIFILYIGISILALALLKNKMKSFRLILLAYFCAFLCSYVQGNFLAKSLPILNGQWIVWSDYPEERIKCIVLWCVVIGAVILLYKCVGETWIYKIIKIVSTYVFLVLCVTLIIVLVMKDGLTKKVNVSATTENLFTMSEDSNYIIFVLDAVSSYEFNKVREQHPEWNEVFEDFTYYTNTFGVYPCTKFTVPFWFSGEWYNGWEEYEGYRTRAYLQSPFLNQLGEEGYDIGIYEKDIMLPKNEGMTDFDNVIGNSYGVNNYWTFIRWNIQIVGFKYAPFDLKRFCFVDPSAFDGLKLLPEGYQSFTGELSEVFTSINEESVVKTDNKVFKYIHTKGGHPPFHYDKNVNLIDDADYASCIEASITMTDAYLKKLKESGVYDNSVIIVLADHGWDTGENDDNALRWQTPILFIKGVNEKHDFQISQAPISYEDMPEAFVRLLAGSTSNDVFDWQEGDIRERRLIMDDGEEEGKTSVYEYVQTGEAWNPDTIIESLLEYAAPE